MQQFKYVLAVAASVIVLAGTGAVAQQPAPAISGAQKLTIVPASKYSGHVYVLTATLETTQWGWFDNAELPRLVIDSGDTVVLETMPHAHGQLWPGRTIEEIKKLRTDWPGRGPMSLTGPIFVNTAEPGDSLRIKIQKIVPRPWGSNFNIPGMFGEFPQNFPDGQVKYFYLDAIARSPNSHRALKSRSGRFPARSASLGRSRDATAPFRRDRMPATWTTAISSRARRCGSRCSFAAHSFGLATPMRHRAMVKSTSRHWKLPSRR